MCRGVAHVLSVIFQLNILQSKLMHKYNLHFEKSSYGKIFLKLERKLTVDLFPSSHH